MTATTELLSEPLPEEPFATVTRWLAEACVKLRQPNPNAMTLATATPEGRPSARVVLCKDILAEPGYVVFYTNYHSRKGRELEANPRAAAVMHWDSLGRQIRLEGWVDQAPPAESDAYFASRALQSRIGAWASAQSEPVGSRAQLLAAVEEAARRFGVTAGSNSPAEHGVPRPPHWGGYRLWAETVELWVQGDARIHDRARWSRPLRRTADGRFEAGRWSATRLQP